MLYMQLHEGGKDFFFSPLVVIPHPAMKEWILGELAKLSPNRVVFGIEFASWQKGVQVLAGPLPCPTSLQLHAAIWGALDGEPQAEWAPFLTSDSKKVDFVEQLSHLFSDYSLHELPPEDHWQGKFFRDLFKRYGWVPLFEAVQQAKGADRPVYLFGLDWMPPAVQGFFSRNPRLQVFRFSPTAMFWEDLRSGGEQKGLLKRAGKKSGALLDLFQDSHPLLNNWTMVGRKGLAGYDAFETVEQYELEEEETRLGQLKLELLSMEQSKGVIDSSIRVVRTGASTLRQVQVLRDEIYRLRGEGVPFSEIRVYAPDMGPFAPLIEFVFSDSKQPIPFRIGGIDLARKSSYGQALQRLFSAATGRWEAKGILALLETRPFYRKRGWQQDDLERFKEWIERAHIRWGMDRSHQDECARVSVGVPAAGSGTWEEGIGRLIESWVYFDPNVDRAMAWSEAELFQDFCGVLDQLKKVFLSWKNEKTLAEWTEEIQGLAQEYLEVDEASEEDRFAKSALLNELENLRKTGRTFPMEKFPFVFVKKQLSFSSFGEIGASLLHGVRCMSLEAGAVLPCRALFLIGMDEESYPRSHSLSSLHLLKNAIPQPGEWDRYLFLESIFAAKEQITFLYGHLSKEDGKAVSPSLLVQELFQYLGSEESDTVPTSSIDPACFQQEPRPSLTDHRAALACVKGEPGSLFSSLELKEKEIETISIQGLSRFFRHPLKQYVEKVLGIELKEEVESPWQEFEFSALSRYLAIQDGLQEPIEEVIERLEKEGAFPPGLFGEEAKRALSERAAGVQEKLKEWGIGPVQTIHCKEACTEERQVGPGHVERPPIQIVVGGKSLQLTGEIRLAATGGALHMGDEGIGPFLKNWPELLSALVSTESSTIYSLKSGRTKQMKGAYEALCSAVWLYMQYQGSPLLLHSEWADPLLRKKGKMEREVEDRTLRWILERSPALDLEKEREKMAPVFEQLLGGLIELFPVRKWGTHAEV